MLEYPTIESVRKTKNDILQRLDFCLSNFKNIELNKPLDKQEGHIIFIDPFISREYNDNLSKTMKISEVISWIDLMSKRILFVIESNLNQSIKKDGKLHNHLIEIEKIAEHLKSILAKINL